MKAACSQSSRLFGGLVIVTVLCLALAPSLTAQGVDPGPRPPGTTPFPPSVCGIVAGIGNDNLTMPLLVTPLVSTSTNRLPIRGSLRLRVRAKLSMALSAI